jgi:pilus assembly protein Flp/PilA
MTTPGGVASHGDRGGQCNSALPAARRRRVSGERGSTATEYAVLVACIAIAIAVGIGLFGTALEGFFEDIANGVADALT